MLLLLRMMMMPKPRPKLKPVALRWWLSDRADWQVPQQ
jgi:hypothetical protein